MCSQGNPLCSKGETEHGLSDPKTSDMPNISTRASSNEYKEIPKSIQDKAREGEKKSNFIIKSHILKWVNILHGYQTIVPCITRSL